MYGTRFAIIHELKCKLLREWAKLDHEIIASAIRQWRLAILGPVIPLMEDTSSKLSEHVRLCVKQIIVPLTV